MINQKIFIAGHNGMVGSAILRKFQSENLSNIITADKSELNLLCNNDVESFFYEKRPDVVVLAAAKVGGIQANIENPVSFLLENLEIQNNVIKNSIKYGIKKFVFLSSSCIYPKECKQPMNEDDILTGKLEPTNEGYALAKITGMKLIEAYSNNSDLIATTLIPCNLYGPNDSFDLNKAHVLSSLVKRFVDAKKNNLSEVVLWGTGKARREFMHVDDLANAVYYFLNNSTKSMTLNIGSGYDISINELASKISQNVGFKGEILWDSFKPEGMLRKCMDVSKMLNYGFSPIISLDKGLEQMIKIYNEKL
jgi:GDP-L-fucose synthase